MHPHHLMLRCSALQAGRTGAGSGPAGSICTAVRAMMGAGGRHRRRAQLGVAPHLAALAIPHQPVSWQQAGNPGNLSPHPPALWEWCYTMCIIRVHTCCTKDHGVLAALSYGAWGARTVDAEVGMDHAMMASTWVVWAAHELAAAARGHVTVLDSEVDLESEHVPEIVRARVPVPIGSAAGAVLGAGERICAECHSRRRADAMVQCKACLRWFHKSCGGANSSMSVGDWVCSPCAVVVPASPSGSPLHTHRRQRREGPWRSR
jgi:hypothetical protein